MLTYRRNEKDIHKRKGKGGFTLVELIVVLVILAVTAAGGAGGLITWQHNSQFRKANEYARTLFTAAQTYMTEAKAQGNLTDLTELFSDEKDLVPLSVAGDYSGRLHYLFWKPSYYGNMDDYSEVIEPGDTPEMKKGKLFYQMFREYLYDKSVLNASICVEFDPVDGVVKAVLYSDRASSMSYNSGSSDSMEITDRKESARREKLLGLYDTKIGDRSPNTAKAPTISKAELVNEDTLDLCFRLENGLDVSKYIYEVEILDVKGRTAASFALNTRSSGDSLKAQTANEDEKYIKTTVSVYKYTTTGAQEIDYLINGCQVRAYVEDGGVVHVTLDAVDLNTAQILKSDGKDWLIDTDAREKFKDTYSILRFGNLFATDVVGYDTSLKGTISAKVKAKGAKDGSWKGTNSESPLIQIPTSRLQAKKYNIANSRHFFNLRFMEAGFASSDYEQDVTYNLTDSFDWSGEGGILDSNKVFRSGAGTGKDIVLAAIKPDSYQSAGAGIPSSDNFYNNTGIDDLRDANSGILTSCAFPAFSSLNEKHTLEGKNNSVKGLYIIPEKEESSFQSGLGLFLENKGTIQNLKLENLNVIGKWKDDAGNEAAIDQVGGLCALNQGTVRNVTVQSGLITGGNCVGGIQAYAGTYPLTTTASFALQHHEVSQSASSDLFLAGSLPLVSIETMIREARLLKEQESSGMVQTAAYEERVQTDLQMSEGSGPSPAGGEVSDVTNQASVEGCSYVGGIVGSVKSEDPSMSIKNCKNEGSISGITYGSEPHKESKYIGGIAGYNEGGKIDSCKSAPALSLDPTSLEQNELDLLLKGKYVGGIVGYNKDGSIIGCSTTGGTLIGDTYVGGIIGYNEVKTEGAIVQGTVDGAVEGTERGVNKANVIGNRYVGGIVGANAAMETENEEPSNAFYPEIKVENWKNRGTVTAREEYGGGITGYNAGTIAGCDCSVDTSAIKGETLLENLKKYTGIEKDKSGDYTGGGSYIGGMAGYNNGQIHAGDENRGNSNKKVVSVVAGNRYVGGMVGYNDWNGDVEGYDLSGGYISGDSFVGGFAGVNVSTDMFLAHDASGKSFYTVSKPNCIEGNYFVGGMVGGNLVLLDKDITISSNTDNFLGQIKSRDTYKGWFVGGLLGYNVNIYKSATPKNQSISIKALAEEMAGAAENPAGAAENPAEGTSVDVAVENVISDMFQDSIAGLSAATKRLTVDGSGRNTTEDNAAEHKLNQIEGYVYVGGAVGYNQKDSHMTIQKIVNKIPVIANGVIPKTDRYSHGGKENYYSYAGGIIGMASQNTVIDSCKNDGAGRVHTPSGENGTTYHGALVEVNEGTIQNCTTTTVGEYTWDYVGGLAGVNGYSYSESTGNVVPGKIETCTVDSTVFGKSCIGGVAAENYGEISGIKFTANATVSGDGENVGGIAGVNNVKKEENGTIVQGKIHDVKMANLKVTGNGTYVGGIAGTNEGVIVGGIKDDNSQNIEPDVSSSVRGKEYVGGIIGRASGDVRSEDSIEPTADSTTVIAQGFTNVGSVIAVNGNAGGIVGYTDLDNYQIDRCTNSGSVEAQQAGNAGGIISTNKKENGAPGAGFADGTKQGGGENISTPTSRKITDCTNTGEVKSGRGDVGGIAAHNDGTISGCTVGEADTPLTFSARKNVGGVTSLNEGTIANTTIQNITVTNVSGSRSEGVGGAAGINKGTLEGVAFTDGTVQTYSKNSNVGGLVGQNEWTIRGTKDKNTVKNVKICFAEDATGNLGGIAGYNDKDGEIIGYSYVSEKGHSGIEGRGGSAFGYGGISGINKGKVSGCSFQGTITAEGNQNAITSVGGIVGVNEKEAQVRDCNINGDTQGETRISAANAYIGGAVGKNSGSVTGINRGLLTEKYDYDLGTGETSESDALVLVKTEKGHIGGIIGLNEKEGSLTYSSTGEKWRIQATETATDNGTGGVIGYTTSDKILRNVQNLGCVIKTAGNSVGGLIGRWEKTTVENVVIQYGVNRGYVKGKDRVGGLVGQIKYTGATFANCENYGTIFQTNSTYTGGMIGYMYSVLSGSEFRFTSCKNFGAIEALNAAGVAGMVSGNTSGRFYFEDCVNAGDITFGAGKKAGGISSLSAAQRAVYKNCRNYGKPVGKNKRGFYGIATSSSYAAFEKCYGVSAERESGKLLYNPTAPDSSFEDKCYYFGRTTNAGNEVFNHVENISVFDKNDRDICDKISGGGVLDYACDGKDDTRWTLHTGNNNICVNNWEPRVIIEPQNSSVNSISIDWYWNGNTKRKYVYSLSYVNKDGTEVLSQPGSFLAGDQDQGTVEGDHAVQKILNLHWVNVEKIILKVTDVLDVNGTAKTPRQYLSIWEIKLNINSSSTNDPDVDVLGQELSVKEVSQDSFTAEGGGKKIENLPYDPNGNQGLNQRTSSYQRYKDIDPRLQDMTDSSSGIPLEMPSGVEMELTFDSSSEGPVGELKVKWRTPTPPNDLTGDVDTEVSLSVFDKDGNPVSSSPLSITYPTEDVSSGGSQEDEFQSVVLRIPAYYINKGYKATAVVSHLPKENGTDYGRSLPYTWVPDFSLDMEESLPLPQFHLEIQSIENETVNYALVWDNASEYQPGDALRIEGINISPNTVNKEKGRIEGVRITPNDSATVSAYVVRGGGAGKTVQSKKVAYQTQLLSGSYLVNNNIANMKDSAFYGETPDTLRLESTLAGNVESFYRTDLMAYDNDLDIEVAVASTVARVPKTDVVSNVSMVLENLPQDEVGNSLNFTKVWAYPWRSQNDVVYYARVVAEHLTADQVKQLDYWQDLQTPDSGYFVEKESDGTYRIIYTACKKQEKGFSCDSVEKPVIVGYTYDQDKQKYTFTWENQAGAKYDVILKGYTPEDQAVELYSSANEKDWKKESNSLTVSSENWHYPTLELTVVRYGESESNGKLKTFGVKETERFSVKLPLTTITAPIILLSDGEDGGKDELRYNIKWGGLQSEDERKYLKEYQVYAQKGTEEIPIPLGIESRSEEEGWDWKNQIRVDFDQIPEINGGDKVEIYVKAIAMGDTFDENGNVIHVPYMDSADGLKVSFQVPTRMTTPGREKMSLTWKKDGETENPPAISRQKFEEEGFLFQVEGQDENDTCIFQAYLVSEEYEDANLPEEGNYVKLEKNPVSLDGSSCLFTGIDSKYAGWYLLIRVRATSDNAISSLWSDYYSFQLPKVQVDTPELEEENKTVERAYTAWSEGEEDKKAEYKMSVLHTALKWKEVKHAETYEIELRKLQLPNDNSDASPYSFYLKKKEEGGWWISVKETATAAVQTVSDGQGDAADQAAAADQTVFASQGSTSEQIWMEMEKQESSGGNGYSYSYDFVSNGELVKTGYEEVMEANITEMDVPLVFSCKVALRLEVLEGADGTAEFCLILPDGEAKGYDFQRTQYVAVKACPKDPVNYEDSKYCQWIRIWVKDQDASAKIRTVGYEAGNESFWKDVEGLELELGWSIQDLIWDRPVIQSYEETETTPVPKEVQEQDAAPDPVHGYEEVEDVPLDMIPAENHDFTSGEEASYGTEDVVDMIPETPHFLNDGDVGQTEEAVDDVRQ